MRWGAWLVAAVITSAAWTHLSAAPRLAGVDWVFWVGLVVIWVAFIVPLVLKIIKAAKDKYAKET